MKELEDCDKMMQVDYKFHCDEIDSNELLNAYSSKEEKETFVIVDDDKPIKPKMTFEELHCSEFDKFHVPLFADEMGKVFLGNGVIVGQYLITAAHVVQEPMEKRCSVNKTRFSIVYCFFQNNYIKLTDETDVVIDGRGFDYVSENHKDLIVYRMEDVYSPLKLFDGSVELGEEMAVMPYRKESKAKCSIIQSEWVCEITSLEGKCCGFVWKNCFMANNIRSLFHSGNSGCALFKDDMVYGILLTANQDGYGPLGNFLASWYIKDLINEKLNNSRP